MPKRVVPLSDTQIRKAKPAEKDYKLSDGGGMFLLVTKLGSKLWRLNYRFAGQQKTLALGIYPDVSLALARERREAARGDLARGVDPGLTKKLCRISGASENSFEVVAREWHAKFAHTWVPSHAKHKLERIEKNVLPWLGQRPIYEITAPEVLSVLRRLESRGILDTAHRVRFECGQIFRYAIATGRAERDPTADLKGALPPVKNGHYEAPIDPKDVAPLLCAIDVYEGSYVVKCALSN